MLPSLVLLFVVSCLLDSCRLLLTTVSNVRNNANNIQSGYTPYKAHRKYECLINVFNYFLRWSTNVKQHSWHFGPSVTDLKRNKPTYPGRLEAKNGKISCKASSCGRFVSSSS